MQKAELAGALQSLATLMVLQGENPFKIRAHQNASRIIETFSGDLDQAIKDGSIGEVKGIGPALKEKIIEFSKSGKIFELEKLKKEIPDGVMDMLALPGLGPKKVKVLYQQLGLESVGALELACRRNRLLEVAGFGEKTQNKILEGIEFQKKFRHTFLFSDAILEAQMLAQQLKAIKGVTAVEVAGSIRRKKELVHDIDLLVATSPGAVSQKVAKLFLEFPQIDKVTAEGETKISVVLKNGQACDLRIVTAEQFPFALLYFTGSKEHNVALRNRAKEKNLKLNEYGLFRAESEKSIACGSEAEIYKALGLDFVEPELREAMGEIEASQSHQLPILVERDQIRGIFHCHTVDSDGVNTLEEMVMAAQNLGFEYIGISDHSASSEIYANGMKTGRVLEQFKRIEALQKKVKIKIFKGIESDILADGSLDYEDDFLFKFDFIIGSLHNALAQAEEKMTPRVLSALKHPLMDFFGHPTARILMAREPAKFDMNLIIKEATQQGVVMELNANPQRLDLDWRYGKFLKACGGRVSINPDAHSVAGLEDVIYGIGIARKGWLGPENVVNTLPVTQILKELRGYGQRIAKR